MSDTAPFVVLLIVMTFFFVINALASDRTEKNILDAINKLKEDKEP